MSEPRLGRMPSTCFFPDFKLSFDDFNFRRVRKCRDDVIRIMFGI